ncbi:MAG: D-sedoheptulose 7-phosphate isomerase [Bacteroidales bacterium]|nr:D-sedoheptulose 7-phosphate isomerase [Bacteroidales bacterium]
MRISESIKDSIEVKQKILTNKALLDLIREVALHCTEAFCNGNKVLFCGNGGSAADAQHLAAEFSGRFYYDRPPLPSEALHVNTSYLTAVANDYSYDEVYARIIRGSGKEGDVLIGISTSGNSANIINAFKVANEVGMITIAMTGESGGKLKDHSDYLINVPSDDTPRIQEAQILIGHIICELVESALFPRDNT